MRIFITKNRDVLKKVASLKNKDTAPSLPLIDPKTFNRKEPYALYIGTIRLSKTEGLDLFDVFGEHPIVTEHNQLPTVSLDKLIEENIPVIGKSPKAGNQEPIQDISRVVKTAQLGSEYDYSSTHFLLPKELAEMIVRWAVESIPENEIVYDEKDPGTKGIQLESHITLKYGLKTNDFEEVKKALESEKAPHIKFGKSSFFEPEGKDYDVVIIPVESESLQKLNENLCAKVEHDDLQFKEYHPHVTVAYVKKGLGKKYDGKDILEGEELDLNVLTFSPKEGEKREFELVKKASFMPSNTDLAPSDDWAGTVGYPTNESMDAPQNVSDEETWYSPENDRPRSKNFLKRMLSLFQKPWSKKEPAKNIVPVKEAEVKKQASMEKYWLAPDGQEYDMSFGAEHVDWLKHNADMLEEKYGIKFPVGEKGQLLAWDLYYKLINEYGWSRIWREGDYGEFGIQVPNIKNVPSYVSNFINKHVGLGDKVYIGDDKIEKLVEITNWGENVQKEVNEALQSERFLVNASINKQAKQWITPTERVNQPGMDWQWADYIYDYVGDIWQDLLSDWLNLDPKNYVKPVILIEKIYEDVGTVSAWVHIEFVNTAANTDAFMKLIISASIESSREFLQHLTDWEIDVKDFGKTDELEKTSGYGPTNYQGPSVADDNMYQDSPYHMNVTWSPEEDEELDDQNGAGGYPNRWFARHRGPYYSNEGKVMKMLEDTKPQKQAAISGQVVNDVLRFIQSNGGATYNLSKGNLVGTDAYAVAIYPDREQVIEGVDFDTLEGYLTQNEDLLSSSNNSFGAWVSGGKVYLDVVATVKDKNEAMQLGTKHKQLAIFDLKNLQEIPLQRVASLKQASNQDGGWISPNGKYIETNDHYGYVATHLADFGLSQLEVIPTKFERESAVVRAMQYIFDQGWIRVRDWSGTLMIQGNTFQNIKNHAENFIYNNLADAKRIRIETDNEQAYVCTTEEFKLDGWDAFFKQPVMAKLAAVYSDREMQKEYDKVFSERWPDDSHPIDGGNEYYDFAEGGSNDYPNPKDEEKEHVYMDQLDNPAEANFPAGLPEYWVTFYDSNPNQGDQGGI